MMPYDMFRQIQTIDIQEVHVFVRVQFDRLTTTTAARAFRVRVGLPPRDPYLPNAEDTTDSDRDRSRPGQYLSLTM
jgi:hypothetical protein